MSERPTPVIVYLSGHLRGTTHRLSGERLHIGTAAKDDIQVLPHELPPGFSRRRPEGLLGSLVLRGRTYELEPAPGAEFWVNGEPVERRVLESGDLLEVGEGGPVLRFRLYEPGIPPYKTMSEIFSDCRDCARHGGGNAIRRAGRVLAGAPFELATQTSPVMRTGLITALVVLVGLLGLLSLRTIRLEGRLAAERARIEGLSELLQRTERNSFSAEDYVAARRKLESRLSDALSRVEALESLAVSRERVISAASRSVVFLQGAYGFVEASSGRPLRFATPIPPGIDPSGVPVALDGSGPPVEIFYTGTAFVASSDGLLLTNRHVALPWEFDAPARSIVAQGFTPRMRRFRGFLPGASDPVKVELVNSSDDADLAVLRCDLDTRDTPALELIDSPPRPGEEVIVLGYPTGMHALLARAEPPFVKELLESGPLNFWQLAERLAAGGHIEPLATVGVVGQVTSASVVYDAETTHGGSGGPVLDLDGMVVAVNAAIVPEFGGSNLGVPAARAVPLLRPTRSAESTNPAEP